jgi:hypothetical protein
MKDASIVSITGSSRVVLRTILIVNFALLAILAGPGNNRQLYLAEKRLGVAEIIVHSLQFWFLGATILAIVLFIWMLVSKSGRPRPSKLDWVLMLIWLLLITMACLFAFMMGMGG